MDLLDALFQTGDISLIQKAIPKLDLFDNPKSTVAFIDHSLKLASATATDRAFGLHLLALAAHYVHQSIFVDHLAAWGQLSLEVVKIQPSKPSSTAADSTTITNNTSSRLVTAAGWKCLGALFHRVNELFIQSSSTNSLLLGAIRRDASALVPKLMSSLQCTIPSNNNTNPDDDEELYTLLQAIKAVPTAFRQHTSLLHKHLHPFALLHGNVLAMQCIASLPAAASPTDGDPATAWSNLAQSILKTIHFHLDVVLIGGGIVTENNSNSSSKNKHSGTATIDDHITTVAKQAVDPGDAATPLIPPPSSTTGSYTSSQLKTSLSIALHSAQLLDTLLVLPFQRAVAVPSTAIVLLVTRIISSINNTKRIKTLLIKGATSNNNIVGSSSSIATKQAIYLGMLEMQISSLKILQHLIDVAGTTLTPLFGHMGRLLADCLDTHIITYSADCYNNNTGLEEQLVITCRALVSSSGLGAVKIVGDILLKSVERILYGQIAMATSSDGGGQPPPHKRARITTTTINTTTHNNNSIHNASISLQLAALHALEALLSVPGGGLTHHQRCRGDALSLHLSLTTHSATSSFSSSSHLKHLQTAAYQCLLSSILCTAAPYRPTNLPQAMQLFAAGLHDSWQPLATVCAHAVMCCEAFLRPRSVPLMIDKYTTSGNPLILSSMIGRNKDGDNRHDGGGGGYVEFGMPLFWPNNNNNNNNEFLSEQQQRTSAEKKERDISKEEEEDKGKKLKHEPPRKETKPNPQVTSIAAAAARVVVPSSSLHDATIVTKPTAAPMHVDTRKLYDNDMEDSDGPLPDIDSGEDE